MALLMRIQLSRCRAVRRFFRMGMRWEVCCMRGRGLGKGLNISLGVMLNMMSLEVDGMEIEEGLG